MTDIKNSSFPYAFFEGKIVPIEEAKVSVMTNALQYGTGIFGGIRGYYNEKEGYVSLFRVKDHFKRFTNALKILNVSIKYSKEDLEKITIDLTKKNKPKSDAYFRPFAYASSLNLSPNLFRDSNFEYAEYVIPLGEYIPVDKGISVAVSSWRRVTDNAIPSRAKISGLYINSALARHEAQLNGHEEAIFLSEDGHVTEGSAMNIFIVRDGVLITPSKNNDILEGIARRTVLQLAKDLGIPTEERSVDRSELYIADEVFFSGTGAQVAWISTIDHRKIGNGKKGEITSQIQDLFFNVVRGQEKKYEDWCTKVDVSR